MPDAKILDFQLTKDTTYHALASALWSIFDEILDKDEREYTAPWTLGYPLLSFKLGRLFVWHTGGCQFDEPYGFPGDHQQNAAMLLSNYCYLQIVNFPVSLFYSVGN